MVAAKTDFRRTLPRSEHMLHSQARKFFIPENAGFSREVSLNRTDDEAGAGDRMVDDGDGTGDDD